MKAKLGVIDSGVGGLTVVKALQRELPAVDIVYFGDTAHNPYGSRSAAEICSLAAAAADRMVEEGATHLVIACNTITFIARDYLANRLSIPVYGMVPEVQLYPEEKKVAVLATPVTIATHVHRDYLQRRYRDIQIVEVACDGLAASIEQHLDCEELLRVYTVSLVGCDAAIWACTHYPLLATKWQEMASCRFIDPANATARRVAEEIPTADGKGQLSFWFSGTDAPRQWVQELFGDVEIGTVEGGKR